MRLTVLICTHNRAALLERVLESLNSATRPAGAEVEILVAANACTDGTHAFLEAYERRAAAERLLPLSWIAEPTPGKSHALNRAIPHLRGDVVAFVDDDHRVDAGYLSGVARAARTYPHASLFCGRIVPDWDGREPRWVHDTGPYRIYPLPVPRFDHGPEPTEFTADDAVPGGGNLSLRREVFERVDGGFATDLGPHGHDLGGGEDIDFVLRALATGARLQYVPDVVQYHYVDLERFELRYLMLKAYQRSRSSARIRQGSEAAVPRYMWRKLGTYTALATISLNWSARRFYLVRTAAALGEIRGLRDGLVHAETQTRGPLADRGPAEPEAPTPTFAALLGTAAVTTAALPATDAFAATGSALAAALVLTLLLLLKSLTDFTQTGPQLREEIQRHFLLYSVAALTRLALWAFAVAATISFLGAAAYASFAFAVGATVTVAGAAVSALAGVVVVSSLQFCRHLLYLPASITASYHYRVSRLYPLWRKLSPVRLWLFEITVVAALAVPLAMALIRLVADDRWGLALGALLAGAAAWFLTRLPPDGPTVVASAAAGPDTRPNILMIGSDTLRADRLGAAGYRRPVTPFLDALSRDGTLFTACYVPCARTAPSLLSLFTGTWPHTHGIRDNFVSDAETRLDVPTLPELLGRAGYSTAAVSDWSGADFGKFPLGFQHVDLPRDQWNVRYLVRQGPKDLRLFLSLFTHSRFGKTMLPELYYLAGVPLTRLVGRDVRRLISSAAGRGKPFFINAFISTTHPPFGSEWPYYTQFSEPQYAGESKFVMARLTDPWDIIRRQRDSKKDFDLDQVLDLYDGCVRNFDGEVRRIVEHVRASGLADNTIIVVYSDHGMEFFEHDTWGQGNSVRGDASAKVPLLILDPRRRGTGACPRIVRSIDLAPTLLDLVGLPAPAEVEGVSLRPYLDGSPGDLGLAAFNETGIWLTDVPGMPPDHLRYPNLLDLLEVPDKETGTLALKPEYKRIVVEAKDRMIRLGRWKLTYQPMRDGPRYALFDVEEDPECLRDVADAHPEVLDGLKARLLKWLGSEGLGEKGKSERTGALQA